MKRVSKIKPYIEYFKYVMEHKKNVFKVCWEKGMYCHAITHDLSKFRWYEFIPYAQWFYGEYGVKIDETLLLIPSIRAKHEKIKNYFDYSWEQHFYANKHHWNHWCYDWGLVNLDEAPLSFWKLDTPRYMEVKYIEQMICDWMLCL